MRDAMTDLQEGFQGRPGNPDESRAEESWKQKLEDNFRRWMAQVEFREADDCQPAEESPPDLYSFYAELCALRTEVRRSARRSHEVFVGFGETLTQFDQVLRSLSEGRPDGRSQEAGGDDPRQQAFRLGVVELMERLRRINGRLADSPGRGIFFSGRKWRSAWASLREGSGILREHFEDLLRHEGIAPILCAGQPFDPNVMKAVTFERTDAAAPGTVLEELSGGYLYKGRVLKFAEVKVAVAKGDL